ncbi:lamin tail domain-containing protein, partial [Candidatus Poribacteria bacterium]|nr:lamin tail domain-containing protein [Candidatus Poribacteria bacterium]
CGLVNLIGSTYSTNLYVMGIHFKCCAGTTEDARRQISADAVAKWFGDLRTPGGAIDLPANTPAIVLGDFNLTTSYAVQPHLTLLTGDIQDEITYGADIKGDWDNTDLSEALPADPFTLDFDTWSSSSSAPSDRFDRMYFTDSVASVAQAFVLNTASMSAAQLAAAGLQATDCADATDHLPIVADLAIDPVTVGEPGEGDLFVTEMIADPTAVSDSNGEWCELYNPTSQAIDIQGWAIKDEGSNFHMLDNGGPLLVQPGAHLVLGRTTDTGVNGSVPVDYAYGTGINLNNTSADALELFRGSRKIDGILFNGGGTGYAPYNRDWGTPTSGKSLSMMGDYRFGLTTSIGDATSLYNASDRGTPGDYNDGAVTAGLQGMTLW